MLKIQAEVADILDRIAVVAAVAHDRYRDLFAPARPDDVEFVIVSALAEGADTIVAKAALARRANDYVLDAPLPFAMASYRADFASDEAKADFDDLCRRARAVLPLPGERRSEGDTADQAKLKEGRAYEAAGLTVLSQADLVLALWDGGESRGRGGTTELLDAAVRQRIPIIHIDAKGESPARILGGGSDEFGVAADAVEDLVPIDLEKGLPKLIDDLVRPPSAAPEAPEKSDHRGWIERCAAALASEQVALVGYFEDRFRKLNLRSEFPIILAMSGGRERRWSDYRPTPPPQLAQGYAGLSPPSSSKASASKVMADAYGWADAIGIRFAQVFRSAVVANFGLAAATVILAVFSLVFSPERKIFFVGAECILIGLIIANTVLGLRQGWHRRWFEAREVAERLRSALPLWALGVRSSNFFGQEPTWTGWYTRAVVRSQGLRDARQNPDWLAEAYSTLQKVLQDQCGYHAKNAEQMGRLERWLEAWGLRLFVVTFVLALVFFVYLLGHSPPHSMMVLVSAFSAGLPALASAIYAIRVIGDFGGIARRSERTHAALKLLQKVAARDAEDLRSLRMHARAASEVMLGDVASWRLATESRALDIP